MRLEEFGEQVHAALDRFHDRAYMQASPLTRILLTGSLAGQEGARLQRLLLEAIEEMTPRIGGNPGMPEWRRSRYLYLRYIEGLTHEHTVQKLGISYRQGHRDRHEGEEELVSLLWQQVTRQSARLEEEPFDRPALKEREDTADHLLAVELAKLSGAGRGPTSLAAVVEDVVGTVSELALARHAQLLVSLEPDLYPVMMGQDGLRQALLGALSYGLELWAGKDIEVHAVSAGVTVEVTLAPSGGPRSRATDLSGLMPEPEDGRLLVSRHLLEMQDGSLAVERPQPTGAVALIRLSLPAQQISTVLIIDDDPDFTLLLQLFLRGHPYRALVAHSAERALQLAGEGQSQIVILDVLMPSQDGWNILRHMRRLETTKDVPVVICSVLSDRALAISLGAHHFLAKPVTQQALLAVLAECRANLRATAVGPVGNEGILRRRDYPRE